MSDGILHHVIRWNVTFFERLHGEGPRSHDRQQGQRPHGEGNMPIPARPAPHFIMIQSNITFGSFKTALDGPAGPGHPHDLGQRGLLPCKDDIGGQLRGRADAASHQQPAMPARLQRRGQGSPAPVIPAWAFGPIAGTQTGPALLRQRGQDALDLPLLSVHPDIGLARDRQHIGPRLGFQSHP
jgi:hypothetical protein